MEYGKRLNELREAKQLSIYKLSQDSGVSQGHISDLENGKYQRNRQPHPNVDWALKKR